MTTVFRITNQDKRRELIQAVDNDEAFFTQKIEKPQFHPSVGFYVPAVSDYINPNKLYLQRAAACAKLSLKTQLSLREFYYMLRGMPDLAQHFTSSSNIYQTVLKSISTLEVLADYDRAHYTVGDFPKGLIHYGHDTQKYGSLEEPIGFTENIASRVLRKEIVQFSPNIIHLEKTSAAVRLIKMGFSKYTNSLISTTSGNFTRAVYKLIARFKDSKNIMIFTDGDAYGQDMLRSVQFGTQSSAHLTPDQAFPPEANPNVHFAGLFPSVAERLGLENDMDQKLPMNNPAVRARIDFIKRYNLLDERDIEVWEDNKTYELEAMSGAYINEDNDPIGLGIYLIEFMRLKGIPCKITPTEDDYTLSYEFKNKSLTELYSQVYDVVDKTVNENENIDLENTKKQLQSVIQPIEGFVSQLKDKIYDELENQVKEHVDEQDPENIRNHLNQQYVDNPKREIFNIREVAEKLFNDLSVEIIAPKLKEIHDKIQKFCEETSKEVEEAVAKWTHEADLELVDLEEIEEPQNQYDVVLEEIGADLDDAEKVREALRWRLS